MKNRTLSNALATVVAMALSFSLACTACATWSGARHDVKVVDITSGAALDLVQDTAMRVACGKPGAPVAPLCLPDATYRNIQAKLETAYILHGKLTKATIAIPNGAASTAETLDLIAQLTNLVNDVIALFPAKEQATLSAQIKK